MFKKFFGGDLFDMDDDDFFSFGGNRNLNQTQYRPNFNYQYQTNPNKGNINNYYYKNNKNNINIDPRNNLSKSTNPGVYSHKVVRPMSSMNPIFVPSRKHKYIKKENQNNNFNNNYINESQSQRNYDPFKKKDSTDLITLPGTENCNLLKNKRKVKPHEIPLEFSKQASGLGQITDAIHENDNESISSNSIKDDEIEDKNKDENELDSSAELEKNLEENKALDENENNNNNYEEDSGVTFKNSIRNKYKKRKSQLEAEKKRDEEKKINKAKPNNNNNNKNENKSNNLGNKKSSEFKSKKSGLKNNDNSNINISYARKLSKMNITSTNWNINQLGEVFTYPEIIFIEE